jgi:hypothetical protein
MFMLKKLGRRLAISFFTLFLFLFLVMTTIVTTARPQKLKTWLDKSGIFQTAPDSILSNLAKDQDEEDKKSSQNSDDFTFSNPGVQAAFKKTITKEFLQSSSNTIIDSTSRWLDGKTTKPDFSIDIASKKHLFADELTTYAKDRYLKLPVCTQPPTTTDPLTINCQSPSFNIDQEVATFKSKIVDSKEFLPKPTLTADTQVKSDDNKEEPVLHYNTDIPQAYQKARLTPVILAVIIVALGVTIIYASDTKLAGLKRIGISFITVGALGAAGLWLAYVAVNALKGRIPTSVSEQPLQDSLLRLADLARQDLTKISAQIVAIYLLLGIGAVVTVHLKTRGKNPKHNNKAQLQSKFLK